MPGAVARAQAYAESIVEAMFNLFDCWLDAELFEADPVNFSLSDVLVTGPPAVGDKPSGWSGLTGPLTNCVSTIE